MAKFMRVRNLNEPSMISSLYRAFSVGNEPVVRQFAELFSEFNRISHLGDGLVKSLAKIDLDITTHSSLSRWRDFWTDWGKPNAEMQVPLRLFTTGVEYLIKQDSKVLLDLVLCERQVLGQVLGIDVS